MIMENEIKNVLTNVKEKNPLTHCITNFVTVNDCANGILAVGGSPIMADDSEEVEEIVNIADVLVINIGKLNKEQIKAIDTGCTHANKTNTPIVLDPVGVGISNLRNRSTMNIINNYKLAAIRGNMSEIKGIAKLLKLNIPKSNNMAKGVDVAKDDIITEDNLEINSKIVKDLALKINTVVIASGPLDVISNGKDTYYLNNGDEMMPQITGSGCVLSSIVGTFIGVNDPLLGSITASLLMSIAGEEAGTYVKNNNLGTGTFRSILIDYLYKTNHQTIIEKGNIHKIDI